MSNFVNPIWVAVAALVPTTTCGSSTGNPWTEADASSDDAEQVSETANPCTETSALVDAAEQVSADAATACQLRFHPCVSDSDCCAPNRCLNITGTSLCQQEGPQVGGPDSNTASTAIFDAGACKWPDGFTSSGDASSVGCWASPSHNICRVPNGGSFNAQDGTIRGPDGQVVTDACQDLCLASEYALTCTGDGMMPASIPSPDSSLGCTVIPVPTPSNVLFYCCPCE
jgi:hypothetical protein